MLDRTRLLGALLGLCLAACAADRSWAGSAQIVIDASSRGPSIGAHQLGTNLGMWYDVTAGSLPKQVASVAPTILRWPGGSLADTYHWKDHTSCQQKGHAATAAYHPHSTFDNFMRQIVIPGRYAAAITLDYGTNAACDGGGDPAEAAAWVAYAKRRGYNRYIHHWTVGNEEFGGWEVDWHDRPHDPATYAAAMSGPHGFYQLIKAADPTAQVGVVVNPGSWDTTVLRQAQYDYVELHWYAQQPGQESDSWLLDKGPAALSSAIASLRQELAAAGKPTTPIMVGEVNSVAYNPGKQTLSVVNALFTGMAIGEMLKDKVSVITWWFGAGGTQQCNKDKTGRLYGWQEFGGYDLVAANAAYAWNYCTNNNGPLIVPEGTVFPSGRAFALAEQFARPGSSMRDVSVTGSPDIRAYAASQGRGYALMLFNLSQTDATTASVAVKNGAQGPFTASGLTYGKQQYDDSRRNLWTGPVRASLGHGGGSDPSVTLPPWSITLLKLE